RAWQIAMERPSSPALSHLQGQARMYARLALLVGMLGAILGATLATLALAASHPHAAWQYGSMANASLGIDASLNGAVPFPADNAWNADISKAKVDPNSDNLIASI